MMQVFPIAPSQTSMSMEVDATDMRIITTALVVYILSRSEKPNIMTLPPIPLQQRFTTVVSTCTSRFSMRIAGIGLEGRSTSAIPVNTSVHGVRWMEKAIRRRYWNPSASKDTLSTTSGATITKTLNTKTNMSVCLERCGAPRCTPSRDTLNTILSWHGLVV